MEVSIRTVSIETSVFLERYSDPSWMERSRYTESPVWVLDDGIRYPIMTVSGRNLVQAVNETNLEDHRQIVEHLRLEHMTEIDYMVCMSLVLRGSVLQQLSLAWSLRPCRQCGLSLPSFVSFAQYVQNWSHMMQILFLILSSKQASAISVSLAKQGTLL
jgi:hypothetical protein